MCSVSVHLGQALADSAQHPAATSARTHTCQAQGSRPWPCAEQALPARIGTPLAAVALWAQPHPGQSRPAMSPAENVLPSGVVEGLAHSAEDLSGA
eukprot:6208082-Pleurochrysis_carterae.AAC.2